MYLVNKIVLSVARTISSSKYIFQNLYFHFNDLTYSNSQSHGKHYRTFNFCIIGTRWEHTKSNSGSPRQTAGPQQLRSRDPEGIIIQISTCMGSDRLFCSRIQYRVYELIVCLHAWKSIYHCTCTKYANKVSLFVHFLETANNDNVLYLYSFSSSY